VSGVPLRHIHSEAKSTKTRRMTKELEPLFSELDDFIKEGSYEEAVQICDKSMLSQFYQRYSTPKLMFLLSVLKLAPSDTDAFTCKCLCLIHATDFQGVLDSINGSTFEKRFTFEKAYSLYRLKNYSDSLAVLHASAGKSVRELELEAQLVSPVMRFVGN